jgi:hypothetical protein
MVLQRKRKKERERRENQRERRVLRSFKHRDNFSNKRFVKFKRCFKAPYLKEIHCKLSLLILETGQGSSFSIDIIAEV